MPQETTTPLQAVSWRWPNKLHAVNPDMPYATLCGMNVGGSRVHRFGWHPWKANGARYQQCCAQCAAKTPKQASA